MKKIIGFVLSIIMICFVVSELSGNAAECPIRKLGDVNNDGYVDAVDASQVLAEYANRSVYKLETFSVIQKFVADVNMDGSVTALDAAEIMRIYCRNSSVQIEPITKISFRAQYVSEYEAQVVRVDTYEDAMAFLDAKRIEIAEAGVTPQSYEYSIVEIRETYVNTVERTEIYVYLETENGVVYQSNLIK